MQNEIHFNMLSLMIESQQTFRAFGLLMPEDEIKLYEKIKTKVKSKFIFVINFNKSQVRIYNLLTAGFNNII